MRILITILLVAAAGCQHAATAAAPVARSGTFKFDEPIGTAARRLTGTFRVSGSFVTLEPDAGACSSPVASARAGRRTITYLCDLGLQPCSAIAPSTGATTHAMCGNVQLVFDEENLSEPHYNYVVMATSAQQMCITPRPDNQGCAVYETQPLSTPTTHSGSIHAVRVDASHAVVGAPINPIQ